jgi:hypothetical protein
VSSPTTSARTAGLAARSGRDYRASSQVGTALQRRLAAFPNQVHSLGRGDDLTKAFRDAEVVVRLAGTLQPRKPNTYTAANLATVAALAGFRVQRVVFLACVLTLIRGDVCWPTIL